jgi:hypothetical protein
MTGSNVVYNVTILKFQEWLIINYVINITRGVLLGSTFSKVKECGMRVKTHYESKHITYIVHIV